MDEPILGRKTTRVASDLNNSLGFVCEEAERLYSLKNGKTALFWHLVGIVQSHVDFGDESKRKSSDG